MDINGDRLKAKTISEGSVPDVGDGVRDRYARRIFSEFRGWVEAKRERAFRVKVMGEA